jgi:hypothetical protein
MVAVDERQVEEPTFAEEPRQRDQRPLRVMFDLPTFRHGLATPSP